jgi:hypothetical protein
MKLEQTYEAGGEAHGDAGSALICEFGRLSVGCAVSQWLCRLGCEDFERDRSLSEHRQRGQGAKAKMPGQRKPIRV